MRKGCGNVAPAPVKEAAPGVVEGELGFAVGLAVGEVEGLGEVPGFVNEV